MSLDNLRGAAPARHHHRVGREAQARVAIVINADEYATGPTRERITATGVVMYRRGPGRSIVELRERRGGCRWDRRGCCSQPQSSGDRRYRDTRISMRVQRLRLLPNAPVTCRRTNFLWNRRSRVLQASRDLCRQNPERGKAL